MEDLNILVRIGIKSYYAPSSLLTYVYMYVLYICIPPHMYTCIYIYMYTSIYMYMYKKRERMKMQHVLLNTYCVTRLCQVQPT
jgi:hypothetical protein